MNTTTLDKMRRMRLFGMYHTFKSTMESPRNDPFTADEMTALLVDSEWDDRHNRTIERTLRNARFRYKATVEQIDYNVERGIDKNNLHRLADGSFIAKCENLLITGSTGTGKSFIASAIGYQACQMGYKVLYTNTIKLLSQIKMAKADGSSIKEMNRIEKQDLLILDDFGIQPFDQQSRASLLEIIEDRMRIQLHYGSYSTNPCATLNYGEVEDYTVNITNGNKPVEALIASNEENALSIQNALSIIPNPVTGTSYATANYHLAQEGNTVLKVVDLAGKVLYVQNLGLQNAGPHNYLLYNLTIKLHSGYYFALLEQSNAIVARNRFIVSK